jgi:hypothetical protein
VVFGGRKRFSSFTFTSFSFHQPVRAPINYFSTTSTMGGRHSRHRDAFTNDLQSDNETNNSNKQTQQQRSIQCCNGLFFCPIPPPLVSIANASHPSPARTNSGHTANTSDSGGRGGGIFGTPIPDTPLPNRRMRDNAVMEKYYCEEKKSTSPAGSGRGVNNNIVGRTFGRGARYAIDNYVSSSKYQGLEKEVSDNFPIEQQQLQIHRRGGLEEEMDNCRNGNAATVKQYQPNAEIHDGPVRCVSFSRLRFFTFT